MAVLFFGDIMKERNAFDQSLQYISYKDRTEYEVRKYLEQKEYREQVIEEVLTKLKYYHYIDDAKYLNNYYQANQTGKAYGRIRVLQDLKNKRLDKTCLNQFYQLFTIENEQKCIHKQMQKVILKYQKLPVRKRKEKIKAFLMRKGFEFEVINGALELFKADIEEENVETINEALEKDFQHYYALQSRKGYQGWELKERLKRNLYGKGYSFEQIKAILDQKT